MQTTPISFAHIDELCSAHIYPAVRMLGSDNNWRVVAIQIEIDENLSARARSCSLSALTHSIWNIQNDNNKRKKLCRLSW